MKSHARVVVIGGGVMGCSLLYHLARLGWQDLVLLEKNELTAGSTWHAAGLCTHYAHNITIMNLRAHSVRLYSGELEADTGQPVSFHACGALRVTRLPDRLDEYRQVRGIGRFAGFDFEILTPAELQAIYPLAQVDDLIGAIYEPLDGHVDPSQATHAMARGARDRGAEIYRNTAVTAIEQLPNREWLVTTEQGHIHAEHLVNAAGTWCREIGDMMGVDLPVVPMLHQYLVTDRIDAFAALERELPMIRDPDESWYLRMERDGVIIGPYEKHGKPWSIDGVPPAFGMELLEPDIDAIADIAALAMARVPAAGEGGIKRVVNGPITFTPDANPLIGPAFGLDNAWLLTGSSMGVMEGGGAGRMLAEWMDGGEPPMDALAVDARRFGGYADRDYRVAKAVECFAAQFGIHYPYEERPAGRPGLVTPVYEALRQHGAVFGSAYGRERPNWFCRDRSITESTLSFSRANWFDAVAQECRQLHENVALADLSVFAKFRIRGADAARFVDRLGANRVPAIGRLGLTHALTPAGGVAAEFSVTRLGEHDFYLASAAAARRQDADLLRQRSAGLDLEIADLSEERGVFGVMGPRAEALLQSLTDADLSPAGFPWLGARPLRVGGIEVVALRVSYVGEAGFELHHALADQRPLFDRLLQAGRKFEAGFYGAFAMNAMRLEMGYRAWGVDLTTERTPLEAGLDHLVHVGKREFIGRDAMLARADRDDRWSLRMLEFDVADIDPFYGHTVFVGNEAVGTVTSAAFGHRLQKPVGLAWLRREIDSVSNLEAEILGRRRGVCLARPLGLAWMCD
ncbi:MAG: FAD-dependent oxidoreductase [Gammaproteobacteria bacterium]|nr:FAD-dependent oxidoreductase [Gammaproteobacteria bacterium]